MSSEERRKILQMVADGKISAEEAATLMRTLDESAEDEIEVIDADPGSRSGVNGAAEFEAVRKRAMRFAMIPLWTGIIITISSAWWMFSIQQKEGLNFWFFCLTLPLMFGILLITLGAGSGSSRWLYVNVDRSYQNEWPRFITLALPLPLGLVGWFLNNFGTYIHGMNQTTVDEMLKAISVTRSITEPLIIKVDDDESGDRVQVFIG